MDFRDGVSCQSQLHFVSLLLEEFGATQVDLKLWRILKAGPILLSTFRNSLLRSTSCHSREGGSPGRRKILDSRLHGNNTKMQNRPDDLLPQVFLLLQRE